MHRCIELARLGAGSVAPNPMVGALLVYRDRIIGEGYHRYYGKAHAEVNCIDSVPAASRHLLPQSCLYVSLEPCVHFGKTPPCADLIIEKGIPKVVIGSRDPFAEVNGRGIEKLEAAGVEVVSGVLGRECRELNRRFFIFHTQHRPYIVLKWAQSINGIIGNDDGSRLMVSNAYSNRLVHRWRSEEASVLVGANTALKDDPELTNRLWAGGNPVRMVVDPDLRLPESLKVFDDSVRTIVFNTQKDWQRGNTLYCRLDREAGFIPQMLLQLHRMNIQSVLVEGGAKLLQSFIDLHVWDEARVITNTALRVTQGLAAPRLPADTAVQTIRLGSDIIQTYHANPFSN